MKLSEFKRAEIIGLRKSSLSIFQISKSTIIDTIQRYEQHQKVTSLQRNPNLTTKGSKILCKKTRAMQPLKFKKGL